MIGGRNHSGILGQAAAACFLLGRAVWRWHRLQDEEEERFRRFMGTVAGATEDATAITTLGTTESITASTAAGATKNTAASTTEVPDGSSQTRQDEETFPAFVPAGHAVPARFG